MLEQGLVQVYTGKGKGKTTAALGLAFRAAGHDLKTLMIQFMKETDLCCGELISVEMHDPLISIKRFGGNFLDGYTQKKFKSVQERIRIGIARAAEVIAKHEVDVLILDEIGEAIGHGLVDVDDVMKLIDHKPKTMEIVLTGRFMPEELIERADLVTEMKEIRHPFKVGVKARKGIEY